MSSVHVCRVSRSDIYRIVLILANARNQCDSTPVPQHPVSSMCSVKVCAPEVSDRISVSAASVDGERGDAKLLSCRTLLP